MQKIKKASSPTGNLDKQRLQDLFSLGAFEQELSDCLKKKKLHLLAAGARASDMAPTHEGRARFIANLNGEAMHHVKDWFFLNATFDGLPPATDACARLGNRLALATLPKSEVKQLWRAVLKAFVTNSEQVVILPFLTRKSEQLATVTPPKQTAGGRTNANSPPPDASERAPALYEGGTTITQVPDLVVVGHHHNKARDNTAKDRLAHLGIPTALSLSDVDLDDRSTMAIVGTRGPTRENGIFFVRVTGIMLDDELVQLSEGEARELFPENGEAIAFPTTVGHNVSSANGLCIWRVDHLNTDKSAHYGVRSFERHAYEVFDVPHPIGEPDKVRCWIQGSYHPHHGIYPLFRLAGGPVIRLSREVTNPTNADFEVPLNGYNSLQLFRFHNRTVFVGIFPAPDFKYDCAPANVLVKRLLKAKAKLSNLPPISKAQVSELAELAAEEAADEAIQSSLERAKGKIGALLDTKAALDDALLEILNLPSVKEGVEEEKHRAFKELTGQAAAVKAEIEQLSKEKARLQAELNGLNESIKKEAATLSSEVKKAFEAAGEEGMKTLGQIAVIRQALGIRDGSMLPPLTAGTLAASFDAAAIPAAHGLGITTTKQLNVAIAQWANYSGLSSKLMHSAVAAAATGMLLLTGSRREELYAALIGTLSGGVVCEVSITGDMFSLSDVLNAPAAISNGNQSLAMPLGDFLSCAPAKASPRTVRLRGMNRMPPESILPELLNILECQSASQSLAWTDKHGMVRLIQLAEPVVFIVDFIQGRSVFPCHASMSAALPVVDTDAPWEDYTDPEQGLPKPRAFMDAMFFKGLGQAHVDTPTTLLESLPVATRHAAKRLHNAVSATGTSAQFALLATLLAIGPGRMPTNKLAQAIAMTGHGNADEWEKYCTNADVLLAKTIFEREANQ